jgi:ribosomal protein S2
MTSLIEDIETVKSNVENNRKGIVGQLESLKTQLDHASAGLNEMDSLRALLEVAMANAEIVAAAEAKRLENANAPAA